MTQALDLARESAVARAFVEQTANKTIDIALVQAELDVLAKKATIENFDVSKDAITVGSDGGFSGEGMVYFLMDYGKKNIFGEELPVDFKGRIDGNGHVVFTELTVDTKPLFGGSITGIE